jgi:hypothetical protein
MSLRAKPPKVLARHTTKRPCNKRGQRSPTNYAATRRLNDRDRHISTSVLFGPRAQSPCANKIECSPVFGMEQSDADHRRRKNRLKSRFPGQPVQNLDRSRFSNEVVSLLEPHLGMILEQLAFRL